MTTRGRVRVEKLRLSDQVLTLQHGPLPIRWIGQRIYGRHFARLNPNSVPIRVQADAIDDGMPSRDFFLSPLHNLYIDGILIPAEALINGSTITRWDEMDPIAYYNIELPVHAVVLAEDLPAESYMDRGDRAMFMNAPPAQFADASRPQSVTACAPILQSGPIFDRVRARIALRAGITPPDIMDRPQDGPLLGKVEWFDHSLVSGWAWLPEHPDVPVVLEVVNRREVIAVALADQFRSDLRCAGIGNGGHAFQIDLPRSLDPRYPHEVTVRRAADGLALGGSTITVPALAPSNTLTNLDLSAMIGDADVLETRRVLEWLERQALKLHDRLVANEAGAESASADRTAELNACSETQPQTLTRMNAAKLARM